MHLSFALPDYFDIIAGTSTGGLLALYLAARGNTYDKIGYKGRLGLNGNDRRMREESNDPNYHRPVRMFLKLETVHKDTSPEKKMSLKA